MRIILVVAGLLAVGFAGCAAMSGSVRSTRNAEGISIDNGILCVSYDLETGTFSARRGQRLFLKEGRFEQAGRAKAESVQISEIDDALGKAKAIDIKLPSGNSYNLLLYEGLPFVFAGCTIGNPTDEVMVIEKIAGISAAVDLGRKGADMRVLGCDGLTAGDRNRTSYVFLAAADPETRGGAVAGWVTHDRASGIVTSSPDGPLVQIEGRSEYGRLRIEPGNNADGETFAIGYFDDARLGLEKYADVVAKRYKIRLPKVPSGYCTWYSDPHGHACDEKHMAELIDFCAENLKKFGFEVLQIDDYWQAGPKRKGPSADYSKHRPDGPYPSGMKPVAEKMRKAGLTPGIWFLPFGSDPRLEVLQEHPDWLVKRGSGEPFEVKWAGTCLDLTHPGVQDYVRAMAGRITREWGYKYTKIDGLYTGMAVDTTYPEPNYRNDDNLGDATFHDPARTNVEAFRDGLKLVRKAAGDDVFILGCTIAQNMRTMGGAFGLVDAIRVGRDISGRWDKIVKGATMGTRLYFLNKRVWHNDPDCLMLREPLTVDQARAWGSWIAISGQLNMVSEWLPQLPAERLEVVKRTMPNHGLFARPVDLFERDVPQIWQLSADGGDERRDVIALFNWDDENAVALNVELERLGLGPGKASYIGFDYWRNEFVGPFEGDLLVELPPGSCNVLAMRAVLDRPQLISTSRHVTQGIVDLVKEKWNGWTEVLSATSKVVGGDVYEVRIFAPEPWKVFSVHVSSGDRKSGVTISAHQAGRHVRIIIESPENRRVSWKTAFEKD
ncbi:MAG: alpha-galactosidase [Planctomycetota bacterium]|jgi:hypothetical protein